MNVIEDSSPNDTTDSDSEEHQPVPVIRMDFTLPNEETRDIVQHRPLHRLPRIEDQPVSLFHDNQAEEMAFPCLFPNGINGFCTARDPPISYLDYIQSRLLNVTDGRVIYHTYCGH